MPEINLDTDPTLAAVEQAVADHENAQKRRGYVGMSAIGDQCERKLFFNFRFAGRETFNFESVARFHDGHRTEDLIIERLKLVPELTIYDRDPETGEQYRFEDHGGHFSGGLDGIIMGLFQAPVTAHALEAKCCAEDKIAKLRRDVTTYGEKSALEQWNRTYWAQAQSYMHYSETERHYLVAATPGGRGWVSVRTEYNKVAAEGYVARAASIIVAEKRPKRVSNKPDFWLCRNCAFADACHRGAAVDRNCRTCRHSYADTTGEYGSAAWVCRKWGDAIPRAQQELEHECYEAAAWAVGG